MENIQYCQEIHPEVRMSNAERKCRTPESYISDIQASFRVSNVKVHDSTIKKQTKQVWLVWKSCQESLFSIKIT